MYSNFFQAMLVMTGRLPGIFQIEFWSVVDLNGNELTLPKFTALTLTTSLLSMLKACVDLNLQRVHVQVKDFLNLQFSVIVLLKTFISLTSSNNQFSEFPIFCLFTFSLIFLWKTFFWGTFREGYRWRCLLLVLLLIKQKIR